MSVPTVCPDCLRRAQLLASLAPYIEKTAIESAAPPLADLLSLGNDHLARSVASEAAERLLAETAAIPERVLRSGLDTAGCWATCRHDSLFPRSLRDAADAPWCLFGRGDPCFMSNLDKKQNAVTIVGARRATTYGREVARSLGRELADAGLTVVSGMAFGVDACAHRGALEAGRTIAVLGCGVGVAYPATHRSLWRRIQEKGLVLSELPPGTGAWRWAFPARSRIMAAFAGMTVVVEAAEKSGSLLTAEIAADLGCEVGAVPGPVGSRASAGPNALLSEGATVVREAQDVLDALIGPGVRRVHANPDPLDVKRSAEALIAEDRVPTDLLRDLLATYENPEAGR
jgi:DNA processing protein